MAKGKSRFLLEFATRLRDARENAGIKQYELARMIYMTPTSISMYENAQRTPNLETLAKIAKILGITIDELTPEPDMPNLISPAQMSIMEIEVEE